MVRDQTIWRSDVPAFRIEEIIIPRLEDYGFPFSLKQDITPLDNTTLFVCSGMQNYKQKFSNPDNSRLSTLQSCIRTNDIDLVGDGTHLTYFEMIGNFSFGGCDYNDSVQLWHSVIWDLRLPISRITYHPSRDDHKQIWSRLGYTVVPDENCNWSDGTIGGECCEVFSGDLEIGNLVNTLGHSTDVGFGWERLYQVFEQKDRIDKTSLFQHNHPIISDHCRCLESFWQNGIVPGNKGRNYVCRRIIRRLLPLLGSLDDYSYSEWLHCEYDLRSRSIKNGKRFVKKFSDKDDVWWFETFGILPEERKLL